MILVYDLIIVGLLHPLNLSCLECNVWRTVTLRYVENFHWNYLVSINVTCLSENTTLLSELRPFLEVNTIAWKDMSCYVLYKNGLDIEPFTYITFFAEKIKPE